MIKTSGAEVPYRPSTTLVRTACFIADVRFLGGRGFRPLFRVLTTITRPILGSKRPRCGPPGLSVCTIGFGRENTLITQAELFWVNFFTAAKVLEPTT
jgi:hypothetical protein